MRAIDEAGTNLGEMALDDAFTMAERERLDVIEIAPNANPPVVRIMDFGKFKYAEAKNMQVAVIYGTEEAKERKVNIKNLREKQQRVVDLDNLITEVKSMLW